MERKLKKQIKNILKEKKLPSHEFILNLASDVSEILEKEVTDYRQKSSDEMPGSLLDFQKDNISMVVVPDLHGRPDFLFNILNFKLPKKIIGKSLSVFKALKKGIIRLIFVGDILHTEKNSKLRWLLAQEDFFDGDVKGPSMMREMAESLSLWCGIFMLKQAFPQYCHILKGNHENILNASSDGDYGFRKYANEGAMVKAFIQDYYGDDVLYMIHCVEKALPLVVIGKKCVISHAEPKSAFTKEQIINARLDGEVIAGLTWTDNNEAEDGSVESVIRSLSDNEDISNYVYLGGHRCVSSKYECRQNGLYIQIHNPSNQNVALVNNNSDKRFNPDKDIVGVQDE